jgi:cytochrome c oxidase assembly protein subunit 15
VALWQFVSGMSNVVLDWPLLAALAHTGGAAALMVILSFMLARIEQGRTLVQRPAVAEALARA